MSAISSPKQDKGVKQQESPVKSGKKRKIQRNSAQAESKETERVEREQETQETPGKPSGETGKANTESKEQEGHKNKNHLLRAPLALCSPRVRVRVWQPIVLDTLRKFPNFTVAAKAAGITPEAIHDCRKRDAKFALAVEQAIQQGADVIEAECTRRAIQGWTEPIFARDKEGNPVKVGEKQLFDSRLAELILKRWKPEYNPKTQTELSGPNGGPIPTVVAPTVIFNIPDNGRGPKPANIDLPKALPAASPAQPGETPGEQSKPQEAGKL